MNYKEMLEIQRAYNKKVLEDVDNLNDAAREVCTQQLALCAHAELSSLVNATNYKKHHGSLGAVDRDTILYESIDVLRYIQAIQNLWNISAEEVEGAFGKKDVYLNERNRIDNSPWTGQPVVIVDMDDVIVDFRRGFSRWLAEEQDIHVDVESEEYYFITALAAKNVNPELIFTEFMREGGFANLGPVAGSREFLQTLKDQGYWIHILTARPEENLRCMYDSYYWLHKNQMPFDDISFSSEKFRWCANSQYYDSQAITAAFDDSPKHASEYAKHSMSCFLPNKSYNKEVQNMSGVICYDSFENAHDDILKFLKTMN